MAPKLIDNDALNALRRSNKATSPRETVGVGGTTVFSGFLQDNEKTAKLKGRERYLTFGEMLANTSIVAASTRMFLNLLSGVEWSVEPADEGDGRAKELADLTNDVIHDMTTPWHRVVRRAGMFCFHGFSIQEWTAKLREDGVIGFLDVEPRPQVTVERWDLDTSGTVHGVVQRSPQTMHEIYLPRERLVYVVDDSLNDSPEGLGLFRHVVQASRHLERFERLEGFGFETDLRGMPVGRIPYTNLAKEVNAGTLTDAQRLALESPVETLVKKHIKSPELGLVIDSLTYENPQTGDPGTVRQFDIELLKSSSTSHPDVARAIERINREIARVFGTEGMLLGSDGKGSLALSEDKSQNLRTIVDATLRELRATLRADLINPLWKLNGWPEELKPTFKTEVTQRNIEQITGALKDMAQAGATLAPDDPAVNMLRDLLGFPRVDLEAAIVDAKIPNKEETVPTQNLPPEDGTEEDEER